MALFTDGTLSTTESLRIYETGILDLANAEGIDLDAKLGLATDEIGDEILGLLVNQSLHDPKRCYRRTVGLSDIVVTPALCRWHAVHTLAITYRDAYSSQLNDRYKAKWDEYTKIEKAARANAYAIGFGLASNPVPKAGVPLINTVPASLAAATYCVQVSLVNGLGQEGVPSDLLNFNAEAGSGIQVQMSGHSGIAAGWNVYAGFAGDPLLLQNNLPLTLDGVWVLGDAGLVAGRVPSNGQTADMYFMNNRNVLRG